MLSLGKIQHPPLRCWRALVLFYQLPCSATYYLSRPSRPESYTLSLHDALPISGLCRKGVRMPAAQGNLRPELRRSEEHTSELQSRFDLVCRLLLEKKNLHAASRRDGTPETTLAS